MNSRKICLVDLDNTLAGYEEALRRDLKRLASPGEPEMELWSDQWPDWFEARVHMIKSQSGWWANLPRLEDGFQIYNEAKKIGFVTEIFSKGPKRIPMAWAEKVIWCQNQPEIGGDTLPFLVPHKGSTYGRVLVDDYQAYMESWLEYRPRGLGIMPARKGNEGFKHPQVVRFDGSDASWREVVERLQWAYDRPLP
jgi:hypothetical protein